MNSSYERYDNGTRVWTTVLAVGLVTIIDWVAVINPARAFHPRAPHTGWWLIALVILCVPPACWIFGRINIRNYPQVLIWTMVLAALVLVHFIPLTWAQGKS